MPDKFEFSRVQLPKGVKDLLSEDTTKKLFVEDKIRDVFSRWGFREVNTPTFELYNVFMLGAGEGLEEKMYKFFDRRGRVLTLRPDMTIPIARLVTSRFRQHPLPLYLSYISNIFRYDDPQLGKNREFHQAGIELIGVSEPQADATVIAVAVECFRQVGLSNFKINIGQNELFRGILAEMNLTEKQQQMVRVALHKNDLVGLEEILGDFQLEAEKKDILVELASLRGGKEVINDAIKMVGSERGKAALNYLAEVYNYLELYSVSQDVTIDLGIAEGFDYYTGVVFEAYTGDLGFPICSGGRYDNLLGRFGHPCPATGFAVGIERLIIALENQEHTFEYKLPEYLISYEKQAAASAISLAGKLRQAGKRVEVELSGKTLDKCIEYASSQNIEKIISVRQEANGESQFVLQEIKDGKVYAEKVVSLEDLINY